MKPILVVYATREGHTQRVADYVAGAIRARGLEPDIRDARELTEPVDLSAYSAAILAASLHLGRHEKEMERFVAREREQLEAIPSAFLSVSLTEAGAENAANPPEVRNKAAREVADAMEAFFEKTAWHPGRSRPVAGALLYTKYNILVRWVMKRIAKSEGGSTDTSRDHVYTDWEALDGFVDELVSSLENKPAT